MKKMYKSYEIRKNIDDNGKVFYEAWKQRAGEKRISCWAWADRVDELEMIIDRMRG